jgi:hypothetical protein
MERNDFPAGDRTQGSAGETGVGGGLGNTGNTLGAQGFAGSTGSTGGATGSTAGTEAGTGFADRARGIAGTAQEKLADAGSTVRERAGTMKGSLADALESGADRLRQRVHSTPTGSGGELAAATSTGTVTTTDGGRVTVVGDRVADGMQATADWIRDADLDNLKQGVERQVKEHPGRTLLIAVGLGYLLGKAFRNR